MKTLYLSILAISISAIAFTQEFTTSLDAAKVYTVTSYKGYIKDVAFNDNSQLIHSNDNVEITDLNTGKKVYTFDFEGANGQTWIDQNGRYVGNYSQNAKRIDNRWNDGVHVLDLQTKKVYTKYINFGYWNKGVFHPSKTQMLLNEYNSVEGTAKLFMYDFVAQKEVKTYFSTSKFSTVIMTMAFSKDGSKIYAVIAPNGYTSYVNVYDTESGEVLKKINFKYSIDKIYVAGDYFFTAGYDGDSGDPFTSKINATTYAVEKSWTHFHMENVYPNGELCLAKEYKSTKLSQYDLKTGEKTELIDLSSFNNLKFGNATAFSPDGKYFFMAKTRIKDDPEVNKVLLVFKNEKIFQDNVFEPVETVDIEEIEPLPSTYNYLSSKPKFSIDFEKQPEETKGETSSGGYKLTLKYSPNKSLVYMLMASELSSKIKESKYEKTAAQMANKFAEKTDAPDPITSTFSVDGFKGTQKPILKEPYFIDT